jgi:hypothetical protein
MDFKDSTEILIKFHKVHKNYLTLADGSLNGISLSALIVMQVRPMLALIVAIWGAE